MASTETWLVVFGASATDDDKKMESSKPNFVGFTPLPTDDEFDYDRLRDTDKSRCLDRNCISIDLLSEIQSPAEIAFGRFTVQSLSEAVIHFSGLSLTDLNPLQKKALAEYKENPNKYSVDGQNDARSTLEA